MKRFVPSVAWFFAGAVLGQLAGTTLFQLWSKLGILLPVAHWFDALGGNTMVKCWFILWSNAIAWFLAAVVGILGGIFVERHFVRYLSLFGIGFVFVPLAIYAYCYSAMPLFSRVVWHSVSIVLLVVCGILSHRRKQPSNTALEPTAAAPSVSGTSSNPPAGGISTPVSSGGGSALDR